MATLRRIASIICIAITSTIVSAQKTASNAPTPGSSISLLFINGTNAPLTAYVERYDPAGQTTYLVNCARSASNTCDIHDATLSIVEGQTYDFHTAVNSGGALTIHCALQGQTPIQCTRTVAGGPNGYRISTSTPAKDEWAYLPVRITKRPQRNDDYEMLAASDSAPSATGLARNAASATETSSGATSTTSATTLEDDENNAEKVKGKVTVGHIAVAALIVTQLFFISA